MRFSMLLSFVLIAAQASAQEFDYDFEYEGLYYEVNHYEVNHDGGESTLTASVVGGGSGSVVIPSVAHHIYTTKELVNNKLVDVTHDDAYTVTAIGGEDIGATTYGRDREHGNPVDWGADVTSVTIPTTVTTIGYYAFTNCKSLQSVDIPNSVTTIGDYAFTNCESLQSVSIPNSVTSLGCKSKINAFDLPFFLNEKEFFGPFAGCTSLKTIRLPESITHIGQGTFRGCSNLSSVTIPNSVTHIGMLAFYDCSSLAEIQIPESVAEICKLAFIGCPLTELTIPSSVVYLDDYALPPLKTLRWNPVDCDSFHGGGWYLRRGSFDLLAEKIIFGESVKRVPGGFSSRNDSLRTIVLSNSIKVIGHSAFWRCQKLEGVAIPSSVDSIGVGAFDDCPSLSSIILPESVQVIGEIAFEGSVGVLAISIPSTVREIGRLAFHIPDSIPIWDDSLSEDIVEWRHAAGLQSITCHIEHPAEVTYGTDSEGNRDQFISHRFENYYPWLNSNGIDVTTCRLLVPKGSVEEYRNTKPWSDFVHIEEIDDHHHYNTDVNGDHRTDVDDLNIVINIMLKRPTPFADSADVTGDNHVDIDDVNAIINSMLGKG